MSPVRKPSVSVSRSRDKDTVSHVYLTWAGWCNLQISICNLAAGAGVTGSREKALQALLLDPMVNDIEQAEQILAAYLRVHADYLPQFV